MTQEQINFGLVHAIYSQPEWQPVKLTFFAPCVARQVARFLLPVFWYLHMYMYKRVLMGSIEQRQESAIHQKSKVQLQREKPMPLFSLFSCVSELSNRNVWQHADHYSLKSRHTVIHNETQSKYMCKWYLLLTMELHQQQILHRHPVMNIYMIYTSRFFLLLQCTV